MPLINTLEIHLVEAGSCRSLVLMTIHCFLVRIYHGSLEIWVVSSLRLSGPMFLKNVAHVLLCTCPRPSLRSWFLECGSGTTGIGNAWELVRAANSTVPPQNYWFRNSGVGPSNVCFHQSSRGLWFPLKSKNHCSRVDMYKLHCQASMYAILGSTR